MDQGAYSPVQYTKKHTKPSLPVGTADISIHIRWYDHLQHSVVHLIFSYCPPNNRPDAVNWITRIIRRKMRLRFVDEWQLFTHGTHAGHLLVGLKTRSISRPEFVGGDQIWLYFCDNFILQYILSRTHVCFCCVWFNFFHQAYLAKRSAGKYVSEMTYFVSGGTQNIYSINQSGSIRLFLHGYRYLTQLICPTPNFNAASVMW